MVETSQLKPAPSGGCLRPEERRGQQGRIRSGQSIKGEYILEPSTKEARVTYRTTMELAISLPDLMRRQAKRTMINAALGSLKKRVESR
jgi:hypothetical protein